MKTQLKPITRLLVANRGEIAIRICRAATELGIRTVALYTYEDRHSLHRYKADEAYRIGAIEDPLKPYLDVEGIIRLAKERRIDAIHPGYGFLSENVHLARMCRENDIIFVGPTPEAMEALGNKILGKQAAQACGIPTVPGAEVEVTDKEACLKIAEDVGYPIMVKAASGGGGRGMRIVREPGELVAALEQAAGEAKTAFGDATVFLERFVEDPKHIEVQIMADNYGNVIHLFERDCSVQRRYQKVVEVAPAPSIYGDTKLMLYDYAVKLAKSVNYSNVGTVEFLVDRKENIYFIEVNPRIQVEHTITEQITDIDIVRSQILIAMGHRLSDPEIYLRNQNDVRMNGFAIQCRITTEDPENDFRPDTGRIIAYRNAAGFGIRLDEGNLYQGVTISPYFDSLLVKVSASGRTLDGAARRLIRALQEFRVRGVKTNIGFLQNVLSNEEFQRGDATVTFIPRHPELLQFPARQDRATKVLEFLAHRLVNGNADLAGEPKPRRFLPVAVPSLQSISAPSLEGESANKAGDLAGVGLTSSIEQRASNIELHGYRTELLARGPKDFAKWLYAQPQVGITDTAMRDAHQSLFATRMRTHDMLAIAPVYEQHLRGLFALETWGGATFDVALRFLNEDPWQRLQLLRQAMPSMLMRMLLRGRNCVGYGFYSLSTIDSFIKEAYQTGIDIFRVFDSFNASHHVAEVVKLVVQNTPALAEAAVCYSGDMAHPAERKFTLDYYLKTVEPMVAAGAHMLCIKDMAGLIKPDSARLLVTGLRQNFGLPVHLHTHDTSSVQSNALMAAIEAGVDGVDCAIASLSGLTSQPNLNAMLALLDQNERRPDISLKAANAVSDYFEGVRSYYTPFEPEMRSGTAEVYDNEIPGGQYSNLRGQARAVGLEDKFALVRQNYAAANRILGRIIKVTPSSKAVGDMALFMTGQGLNEQNFHEKARGLAFPESVRSLVSGQIGTPDGGWPEGLVETILDGKAPQTDQVQPEPMESEFRNRFPKVISHTDYLSYLQYPKVFEEYDNARQRFGDVWYVPTPAFLYGLAPGEEIIVSIAEGKDLIVRCLGMSDNMDEQGQREVRFELNGQTRHVRVLDEKAKESGLIRQVRMAAGDGQIGAPMPGRVSTIKVAQGDAVEAGQVLFVLEAMKMESSITAPKAGTVKELAVTAGAKVQAGELVIVME